MKKLLKFDKKHRGESVRLIAFAICSFSVMLVMGGNNKSAVLTIVSSLYVIATSLYVIATIIMVFVSAALISEEYRRERRAKQKKRETQLDPQELDNQNTKDKIESGDKINQ
jgi:membrane protein implicated in regulation of membrane protease activity